MIKIHFYEKSTELQGKPINIEDFLKVKLLNHQCFLF